jgi:transketolase
MKNPSDTTVRPERLSREFFPNQDYAVRHGILKLLAIKDSDVRLLTLEQCRDAVDKGLHAGGAFSSTIPLVALF